MAAPVSKKHRDNMTKYHFVVEIYEINENKVKMIRSVPLMKDKDNALYKAKYLLKRASFVTNGKILLMIHKRQMFFFDLATGIRLSKTPLMDDLKSE